MELQFGLDSLTIRFSILTICFSILTHYQTVMDRERDISTMAKTALCNASQGKNPTSPISKDSFWAIYKNSAKSEKFQKKVNH